MQVIKIIEQNYESFVHSLLNKKVFIFCDINTVKYTQPVINEALKQKIDYVLNIFPDHELIPLIEHCESLIIQAESFDYILAFGSGSINDMGKYIAKRLNKTYGIVATAPSMDGYASMGSALMNQGIKMTYEVNMPNDLIVDLTILKQAPSPMIASGFGDIIGKYTSLADWKLSNIINDEMIHQESYQMMEKALRDTINAYDSLLSKEDLGIELLTDALITAGTSMALCTNSRPASGSEHHISHYLEMEFIKAKKTVPLHGFKVALGSMVILDLYRLASFKQLDELKRQKISEFIKTLPTSDEIRQLLAKIGAPLRFSDIGVSRELLKSTLLKAYLVRNRFTILTWMSNDEDYLTYCDLLVEKYL